MAASRSADLCWGQRYHWLRYQQAPAGSKHEMHITDSVAFPDGVAVADLRAAVGYLCRRHEVLRTVYDIDTQPWPRQVVQSQAALPITFVSTESDGTPSPAEVVGELSTRDFDLAGEWPVRVCAITTGGVVHRVHLVLNHIAVDDVSLDKFRAELGAVLAAVTTRARAALPPVAHQPVDLARHESTQDADAMSYWRTEIGRLPVDVFAPRRTGTRSPEEAHSASLTSPSLHTVAKDIAARHRVWPSAVHLAAYAVVTAAYTGAQRTAHQMFTSQRQASGHPAIMTCMSSPSLISLDLADDPPFSEVLRRATAQVDQALANAHVPYDELLEQLCLESVRRGSQIRLGTEFNLLSYAPRTCGARRVRFTWNPAPVDWARSGVDSYFRIYEWQDGLTVMLMATADVMDTDAVEKTLRGYDHLLTAHQDPTVDLTVSAAAALMDFTPVVTRTAQDVPVSAPAPEALRALVVAVGQVNGLPEVRSADSYIAAGGRVLRVPRLLAELSADGWDGLTIDAVTSFRPLRTLAAELRPTSR
ncbi:MAG TPA: condensation domain-containing protein [Actinokineospora sp.]|nr:condensation domain-containing protein [Actinokineospora sp.]